MSKLNVAFEQEEKVVRVVLASPKANVIDMAMMEELEAALRELKGRSGLRVMILSSEGPHFSFGAGVQDHLPEKVRAMLTRFHGLLRQLLDLPVVTVAAVRGQCLGGGFELALACDFIIAEEGAAFASPEIKLAVFPPAAAALLPVRIGASRAAELVLTGAAWTASQLLAAGLVARTAPPTQLEAVVDAWIGEHFLPRSAAALRHAVGAARLPLVRALQQDLPQLERLYLEELMAEPDATEGLRAFLEKRAPVWDKRGKVA
jgi:cyclohexa-1,5-dienecarbonyl-CoA hydratase